MHIHSDSSVKQKKGLLRGKHLIPALFFPLAILYGELLLRVFCRTEPFFSVALLRIFLFSAAAGFLVYCLLDLSPWKKAGRGIAIGLTAVCAVILCVECCCKNFFKTYFSFGYMSNMAGQVAGDFFSTALEVTASNWLFILLALLPLVACIILRKDLLPEQGCGFKTRVGLVILVLLLQFVGVFVSNFGEERNIYTYDFNADEAIEQFGVVTSFRLEIEYAVFGVPEAPLPSIDVDLIPTDTFEPPQDTEGSETPDGSGGDEDEPVTKPVTYGYNVLDIDFESLIAGTKDSTLASMHQYFSSLTPTQQNEYTGYFEGKNLILITAEAFSPYLISEELTPTLYRLSNEGFVFTNYYQPNWGQSTTGGEFAVMTGLIPNWIDNRVAFSASAENSMPTALGWLFGEEGYQTPAYHNNSYTYYKRHLTHPNLGYDFIGVGNGLVLPSKRWPSSDLEMMQATTESYIRDYVENGVNFHTYYMTVSGHANYNFLGNAMSQKNKEIAQAAYPNASETVQAYIACNLELEYAMAYLIQELEAAGIADDTVIVLTADHYPYGMVTNEMDYYTELSGVEDRESDSSRYRNTLILWCGSMEEPVVVDVPCSSIDIVPTLCNLFGLEYDSRLYSGRDILATNYNVEQVSTSMPLVVFPNKDWITAAGTYDAQKNVFTPNEGISVDDGYVAAVKALFQAKYTYAKLVVQKDYYSYVFAE